ncbi:MAG: hypothetical protein U0T82_06190 [Bacteroidales bacterium]
MNLNNLVYNRIWWIGLDRSSSTCWYQVKTKENSSTVYLVDAIKLSRTPFSDEKLVEELNKQSN